MGGPVATQVKISGNCPRVGMCSLDQGVLLGVDDSAPPRRDPSLDVVGDLDRAVDTLSELGATVHLAPTGG